MNYQITITMNSTNKKFCTGSKLAVNYQILTYTKSTKSNATSGSELIVNYQISTKTNSTNSTLLSSYSKLMGILSEAGIRGWAAWLKMSASPV